MYRSHVDDRAALVPCVHVLQGCPGDEECRIEVDAHDASPILVRELVNGSNILDAGIADGLQVEYIPATLFLHDGKVVERWYGDTPVQVISGVVDEYMRHN